MAEEFEPPKKSLYQIYLTEKETDKVLLDVKVIAFNESEAIRKTKVGKIIKNSDLGRDGIDFFIKVVGHLYEGETFYEALNSVED